VRFDQGDPFAVDIERRYRLGTLNAVSVGWGFVKADGAPVKEWWRLTPAQIASKDIFYDLEEISAVTVPGDPRAVRAQQARATGWSVEAGPRQPAHPGCTGTPQCWTCEAVARRGGR
jgi:hypothetical protein